MTLDAQEFIRRFLLHVFPHGYVRIRHFGFLSNHSRESKLAHSRQALEVADDPRDLKPDSSQDWKARYEALAGKSLEIVLPAVKALWFESKSCGYACIQGILC